MTLLLLLVILSRDFEYMTLNTVGLFRSWKSMCKRAMVFKYFDAIKKQFPLEQASRSHVRVLDYSCVTSYGDSQEAYMNYHGLSLRNM